VTTSSGSIARSVLLALALLLGTVLTGASQEMGVAGLVVDYGDGWVSYAAVPFEEDEISGLELLRRSGLDIVTVGFGGLGDAVCQIDDTGCTVDDCRTRMCQTSERESPFWQFSKLEAGAWLFVATGVSGAQVRDGDIYAWSWTGVEPDLPVLTLDELAGRAGGDPLADNEPGAMLRTIGGEDVADEPALRMGLMTVAALGTVLTLAILLVLRVLWAPKKEPVDER
jgi:hypothetical protein